MALQSDVLALVLRELSFGTTEHNRSAASWLLNGLLSNPVPALKKGHTIVGIPEIPMGN